MKVEIVTPEPPPKEYRIVLDRVDLLALYVCLNSVGISVPLRADRYQAAAKRFVDDLESAYQAALKELT